MEDIRAGQADECCLLRKRQFNDLIGCTLADPSNQQRRFYSTYLRLAKAHQVSSTFKRTHNRACGSKSEFSW